MHRISVRGKRRHRDRLPSEKDNHITSRYTLMSPCLDLIELFVHSLVNNPPFSTHIWQITIGIFDKKHLEEPDLPRWIFVQLLNDLQWIFCDVNKNIFQVQWYDELISFCLNDLLLDFPCFGLWSHSAPSSSFTYFWQTYRLYRIHQKSMC